MSLWKHLRFLQNLRVDWRARVALDSAIFISPFVVLSFYPFTLFEFVRARDLRRRKKGFEEVHLDKSEALMGPEQVASFYHSLGFDQST